MSASAPFIDFHAHILPGADHGSSGIEEALNQLALIRNAGVDTVVATPHFYPNRHRTQQFLRAVDSSAEKLAAHLSDAPRVCIGAEVLYCDRLDTMEHLETLCIRGTNILLLELPLDIWNRDLFETVECLTKRFCVLLAHVDRYVRFQQEELLELLMLGAYAQINADALFSFIERRKLLPLLETGRIVALGSDLHHPNKRTYERFCAAKGKLGAARFSEIMQHSEELLREATALNPLHKSSENKNAYD